jgi:lipid-A-disaccharide synthase
LEKILIIAGEPSGDNIGGLLSAELKLLAPEVELFGIGGDRMDMSGVNLIYHVNQLSFLGFWEVMKHLPFIREVEKNILTQIDTRKPDLAILIDYPGFNLRLAKKLKDRRIPIMYYVSPQVWAWGRGRIGKIKSLVSKMIVAFEFEKRMYESEGLLADWFGHPLLEIVHPRLNRIDFLKKAGLSLESKYIGLFPGSRKQEIEKILPIMRDSLIELSKLNPDLFGLVGCAPGIDDKFYSEIGGRKLRYFHSQTYDLMAYSELNLVASGTATLESAIMGKPLFILYKTSIITYLIAKNLIKIPYIGLVNVVAEKKIVPEFIQGRCKPELIAIDAQKYLNGDIDKVEMLSNLESIKGKLGKPGASKKVAEAALKMIRLPA